MRIESFIVGESRTGLTSEVAFFTVTMQGQIIDACPLIERLTGQKLHDDGKREFFVIRVPTRTIKSSIAKVIAKAEAKFSELSKEEEGV